MPRRIQTLLTMLREEVTRYANGNEAIAERTEYHPADRAHEEGSGKGPEGGDQLRGAAGTREEDLADDHSQIAVNPEVEPLHGITERSCADGFFKQAAIDNGNVVYGQFVAC